MQLTAWPPQCSQHYDLPNIQVSNLFSHALHSSAAYDMQAVPG